MKIVKIHYYHTFPILKERGIEQWQKIGLEAELDENDDVRQSLYSLKKQVENFHYESKGADEKQMGMQIKEVTASSYDTLENDIYSCNDLKVLDSYKLIAKTNPILLAAYNTRKGQLESNIKRSMMQ